MRTNLQLAPAEVDSLLSQYAETGRPEFRDRVVEAHLYIAEIIARRFSGRGVDYDDLYQVAAMALFKAVSRFDTRRGIKFASFVTPSMVGEVKNYFRDKSRLIRPPRRSTELLRLIEGAREKLTQALGRSPRSDEIADAVGLAEEDVLEALEVANTISAVSLDQQTNDEDDEHTLAAMLGGEDKRFGEFETADMLDRAMDKLSDEQRTIIRLRFFAGQSQREIAEKMNISQMSVSRAERRALEVLRRELRIGEKE